MDKENAFTIINPVVEPTIDKLYRVGEAISSIVPTGTSIYQSIFTNPVQSRTSLWMKEVEKRIRVLDNKGEIDLLAISERPEFSAIFLRLLQEVEVSSQEEKLSQLANFAINLALGVDVEVDELYILTEVLKSLTPSHIKALDLYMNPDRYDERFREIHSFASFTHLNCDSAYEELSIIFHKDRNEPVMAVPNNPAYSSHGYWSMIHKNLSGHHLITLEENTHLVKIKREGYPETKFTILLNCKATEVGGKLLRLLSSPLVKR
ncbi:hypothetical protein H4J57_09250 [Colwellia sp. BRX8-7]|jgi:hypothetical protein|uniref:hypothetical protein n=1 Tax=Colwellia sp. BRX8-7 TaxID=2759833 RepID=UPI0015F53374|nr:hypothetical protein [Colwellia sp. BRX8-7]MBA6337386.1 hypothetical protein [Colwellia sp. BRX8-7]